MTAAPVPDTWRDDAACRHLDPELFRWTVDTNGCWLWAGNQNGKGYGALRIETCGPKFLAHRLVYAVMVGPIPKSKVLDHLCRNTLCVNPVHLEPVSPGENLRRGYEARGLPTHCRRGHDYAIEGRPRTDGGRDCRACDRERSPRHRRSKVT